MYSECKCFHCHLNSHLISDKFKKMKTLKGHSSKEKDQICNYSIGKKIAREKLETTKYVLRLYPKFVTDFF